MRNPLRHTHMKLTRTLIPAALAVGLLAGCGLQADIVATPSGVTVTDSDPRALRGLELVRQLVTVQETLFPVYVSAYDLPKKGDRGIYRQAPGYLDAIFLDPHATVGTMVHELGHYIDYRALDRFTTYGTVDAARVGVLLALNNSQQAFRLQMVGIEHAGTAAGAWAEYADDSNEMFARAFVQWVAIRTADAGLLAEVATGQEKGELWQWNDFTEIAVALDNLFQLEGTVTSASK